MAKGKVHMRDIRLRVNAGMDMPLCYAAQKGLLDIDKSGCKTVGYVADVTCKHCLRVFPKRYPWASGR